MMMSRVTRNVLIRSTNEEWLEIIGEAQKIGALSSDNLSLSDLESFNQAAANCPESVEDFLKSLSPNQCQ